MSATIKRSRGRSGVPRKYEEDIISAVLSFKRIYRRQWEQDTPLRLINAVAMYEEAKKRHADKRRRGVR